MSEPDFDFKRFAKLVEEDGRTVGCNSHRDLAAFFNLDESQISRWMRGRSKPSVTNLEKILQCFGEAFGKRGLKFTNDRRTQYWRCRTEPGDNINRPTPSPEAQHPRTDGPSGQDGAAVPENEPRVHPPSKTDIFSPARARPKAQEIGPRDAGARLTEEESKPTTQPADTTEQTPSREEPTPHTDEPEGSPVVRASQPHAQPPLKTDAPTLSVAIPKSGEIGPSEAEARVTEEQSDQSAEPTHDVTERAPSREETAIWRKARNPHDSAVAPGTAQQAENPPGTARASPGGAGQLGNVPAATVPPASRPQAEGPGRPVGLSVRVGDRLRLIGRAAPWVASVIVAALLAALIVEIIDRLFRSDEDSEGVISETVELAPATGSDETSAFYDFENDVQFWGEHPDPGVQKTGRGVTTYCGQPGSAQSGDCSLEFPPTAISGGNAYVTVVRDTGEAVIEAYVNVPATYCTDSPPACSTAKLIAWDADWKSDDYEGAEVDLRPGWKKLSLDLHGKGGRRPFREVGVHVWFLDEFKGRPVYVDAVRIVE